MKLLTTLLGIVFLASCSGRSTTARQQAPADPQLAEMRTIESVDPRPKVVDPPPVLSDEALSPPPKPKQLPWQPPQVIVLSPEDDKVRASLPFAPAIAMDPVNGDKISIRAATPTYEFKGRIYYFSNEENRRTFIANPEQAIKGGYIKL
jgi:YHS domain-containing protein